MDQVLGQKPHPKNVHFKRRDGKPLKWKESAKEFAIHKDAEKALARMEEVMMKKMMVEEIKLEDELDMMVKQKVRAILKPPPPMPRLQCWLEIWHMS
jgi:hypothetical protein